MNYSLKSNRKKKIAGRFAAIWAAAILAAGLLALFAGGAIADLVSRSLAPFLSAEDRVRTAKEKTGLILKSPADLKRENMLLKEEIARISDALADRNFLRAENARLKNFLGRDVSPGEYILAGILARPDDSLYDTLVLDAGVKEGVRSGDFVIAPSHTVIGKIAETRSETSKAILFGTPGETLAVIIGEHDIAATALGKGGGTLLVRLPRGADVEMGDLVTAPGASLSIIGSVVHIEKNPSDSFQELLIESNANMHELKWVFIARAVSERDREVAEFLLDAENAMHTATGTEETMEEIQDSAEGESATTTEL